MQHKSYQMKWWSDHLCTVLAKNLRHFLLNVVQNNSSSSHEILEIVQKKVPCHFEMSLCWMVVIFISHTSHITIIIPNHGRRAKSWSFSKCKCENKFFLFTLFECQNHYLLALLQWEFARNKHADRTSLWSRNTCALNRRCIDSFRSLRKIFIGYFFITTKNSQNEGNVFMSCWCKNKNRSFTAWYFQREQTIKERPHL